MPQVGVSYRKIKQPFAVHILPCCLLALLLANTACSPAILDSLKKTAGTSAPQALDQTLAVNDDATLSITLHSTPEPDATKPLAFILLSNPAHGTLSEIQSGIVPTLTYTPTAPYSGVDSFMFKVVDGDVESDIATVTINVTHINHAPVANAQSVTVDWQSTNNTITLVATDSDNDTLTYSHTNPSHGTVGGSGANLTYTPDSNYSGSDSFTFKANDGTVDSNTATVSITVNSFCSGSRLTATPFASGNGSNSNPYKICTATQFATIASDSAKFNSEFEIWSDIDLAPYYSGGGSEFSIGTCGTSDCASGDEVVFGGIIHGKGHTISNYQRLASSSRGIGLVAYCQGCQIKNLKMDSVNIQGSDETGGFIGYGVGSVISRSFVSGSVTGGTNTGGFAGLVGLGSVDDSESTATITAVGHAGGILGHASTAFVHNSRFNGSVTGTTSVGGIMGDNAFGILSNSYALGTVTGSSTMVGGVTGQNYGGFVINSYSGVSLVQGTTGVGGVTGYQGNGGTTVGSFSISEVRGNGGASANVGRVIGQNTTGSSNYYFSAAPCDADSSTGGIQACNTTAAGSSATLSDFYDKTKAPLNSWDFVSSTSDGLKDLWVARVGLPTLWFEGSDSATLGLSGTGTTSDPYLITNSTDFNLIAGNPRWMGSAFRLTQDIDFTSGAIVPISDAQSCFFGSLEGNGHTLKNFALTGSTYSYSAPFGMALGKAVISKVGVVNASISNARHYTGGLIGLSAATVSDVFVSSSTTIAALTASNASYYVGGLVGTQVAGGSLARGYSAASVTGYTAVAGIVGNFAGGTLSSVFVTGPIQAGAAGSTAGPAIGSGPNNNATYDNVYIWASSSCDKDIMTGGVQACNTTFTSSQANVSDFYSTSTAPLTLWDFTNIWQTQTGSYPILR